MSLSPFGKNECSVMNRIVKPSEANRERTLCIPPEKTDSTKSKHTYGDTASCNTKSSHSFKKPDVSFDDKPIARSRTGAVDYSPYAVGAPLHGLDPAIDSNKK